MGHAKMSIYHVSFPDRYLLTSTFLRFQEHYESPRFSGKIFTLEEYMDWYVLQRGRFSYFEDWSGFNIPSSVLKPFYKGKFDPLTKKEKMFLEMFEKITEKFYVIGSVSGDMSALLHEVVHGLFYLFPEYRKDVISCLSRFNVKSIEQQLFKTGGYANSVMNDEINAYMLLCQNNDICRNDNLRIAINAELIRIFIKHFGCSPHEESGVKKIFSKVHRLRFNYRK